MATLSPRGRHAGVFRLPTPISSSTSYASASDLLNSYDATKIGQYATDTGVTLTPGAILTDTKVAAALLRASGEVEMSCYRGGRYTPTQLAALTGASAAALKGLVCDLAYYRLAKRRIPNAEETTGYKEAQEVLKALRDGELVFGLQETAEAGAMDTVDISTNQRGQLNRPTDILRRYFGRRFDDDTGFPLTGSR